MSFAQTLLAFLFTRTSGREDAPRLIHPMRRPNFVQLVSSTPGLGSIVHRSVGLLRVLIGWRAVRRYRLVLFQLLDLGSLMIDLTLLC